MKKRYMVTLTEETAEQIKADLATLGLPAGIFSRIIDEALAKAAPAFRRIADRHVQGDQLDFTDVIDEAQKVLDEGKKK